MEQLMARNVFAPHEAAIIDGNYRAGRGLPMPTWMGAPWPGGENPVPAVSLQEGFVSVHRAQAQALGFPERQTAPPPSMVLAPYDEPPLPGDINRGKTEIIRRGRDFEIIARGTTQGGTYHLVGCHGDRENPADWRYYGHQVAGPDGQVSFLVTNPTAPTCIFEVVIA